MAHLPAYLPIRIIIHSIQATRHLPMRGNNFVVQMQNRENNSDADMYQMDEIRFPLYRQLFMHKDEEKSNNNQVALVHPVLPRVMMYRFLERNITFSCLEEFYQETASAIVSDPGIVRLARFVMKKSLFVSFMWTDFAAEFGLPPKPDDDYDPVVLRDRFGLDEFAWNCIIDTALLYLFGEKPTIRICILPQNIAPSVEYLIQFGLMQVEFQIDPRAKKHLIERVKSHLGMNILHGNIIAPLMEKVWLYFAKLTINAWGDHFLHQAIAEGKQEVIREIFARFSS